MYVHCAECDIDLFVAGDEFHQLVDRLYEFAATSDPADKGSSPFILICEPCARFGAERKPRVY